MSFIDPRPMIVDSFAGGGGASTGIENALGRSPDVAINHSAAALALHAANHPGTLHLPDDTPLKERMQVVDAARPHWGGCSWPRKAWQAARRDYLVRFGYQPRTKKAKAQQAAALPLFPDQEER